MRQPSIIILLIVISVLLTTNCGQCAVKGGIEYTIPTDYSKLSESELNESAKKYYHNALRLQDGKINEDMTNALMLYSILLKIKPENDDYGIKLGILYDKAGMDRYAKGNFARVIGNHPENAEVYFYFGEFYYKRSMLIKAMKYYKEAYKRGMQSNSDLLKRMSEISRKLGDEESAKKYEPQQAKTQLTPTTDLPDLSNLEEDVYNMEPFEEINEDSYSDDDFDW